MTTNYFDTYQDNNKIIRRRIINTPSEFSKKNLFYIQETGYLRSQQSHSNMRKNLKSFLFFIVLSGKGYLNYKSHIHMLQPQDCVLIDCMEEYSHGNDTELPWELLWIHFNGNSAIAYYRYLLQYSKNVFRVDNFEEISENIRIIMSLHENRNISTEILSSKLINDILTLSIVNQLATKYTLGNTLHDRLTEVRNYLDIHYTEKITLDFLEQVFYTSKYHLSREFKHLFGTTIISYIQDKRIIKAKELLRFTDLSIESIAHKCGILDSSYFNKLFKKSEGMTASDYRKQW